jgi:hypothetical protein
MPTDDATSTLAQTLTLHREDPSPSLNFTLAIDRLMDDDHCRNVSVMLETLGGGWMTKNATRGLWQHLPAKPGLYMFVWAPRLHLPMERTPGEAEQLKWVLYVGKTGDKGKMTLRDRYRGEYSKYVGCDPEELWVDGEPEGRAARLGRYLRIHPLEYWYMTIEDRAKIGQLERRLIALLGPPLNRSGHPRLQKNKPTKAF